MKNLYRKWRLAKNYVTSLLKSREFLDVFDKVETYCMFLGYSRSGHTLISSLLDAHPDVIVANELHALRYIRYGFGKRQLFYLLLAKSKSFARKGQTHTGYSYGVPHQWQGRFRELRVIGDKRGGGSVRKLQSHAKLLQKLRNRVGIETKFIHIVRNPYDNISTLFFRGKGKSLKESIDHYFYMVEGVANLKKQIPERELIEIRHELFIQNPVLYLKKLCEFIGVDATEDYLNDCASIVFDSPRKTRQDAPWNPEFIEAVSEKMRKYPFLDGYSFED